MNSKTDIENNLKWASAEKNFWGAFKGLDVVNE